MDVERIGGYHVVRLLGKGGMAEVYEAVHEQLGVHRALKVFTGDGERAELLRSRFLAEGRLLARLEHPRLVKVYDCGMDETTNVTYLTMDLVLGTDGKPHTLAALHKARQITEEKLLVWYADLIDVLAYIHASGVVHRDVKPSNILIGADGHAVLADFGVSRISDADLREELSVDATMATDATTLSRIVFGTANYLAPEVRHGNVATAAADIYALGVTFFRLLTGVWYEPDSNAFALLDSFDPAWRRIFPALLAADPDQRFMPSPRRSDRRWIWVVLAAAVATAVIAGISLHSGKSGPADRRSVDDIFFVP